MNFFDFGYGIGSTLELVGWLDGLKWAGQVGWCFAVLSWDIAEKGHIMMVGG